LPGVIDLLEAAYGAPKRPASPSPWEMILRENVVYLAGDRDRDAAFRALKKEVGLRPRDLLKASPGTLRGISGRAGILADNCARKLREAAEIAEEEFGGDVDQVLEWPVARAKRGLKLFPGIGAPGAEKILMFAGRLAVLALESNGLRVLVRLGFASEQKNYAAMYRAAQAKAMEDAPSAPAWLAKAHQLLRNHGQVTCKRTDPLCEECVLRRMCPYASGMSGESGDSTSRGFK
jgi:endonuclease III